MYVPPEKLSWLRVLFKLRGSVLPRILPRIVFVTLIAMANTGIREELGYFNFSLTTTPFTLIGLPLGIFLGFRNGASYDRFWEGRKLWGALVNTSRTFTRQLLTMVAVDGRVDAPEARAFQREMVLRVVAYVRALKLHLRGEPDDGGPAELLPEAERGAFAGERNLPIALLHRIGERLGEAHRNGWISDVRYLPLDASLTAFCDIQGACERIKNTPVPFSYSVLIHRIVALYCFLLPFGLVESIHWLTPLVVAFISYAFFGLDQIGEEIEDPFGTDVNDLPLAAISRTIEINLRQRIGDAPPAALEPSVDGVLL